MFISHDSLAGGPVSVSAGGPGSACMAGGESAPTLQYLKGLLAWRQGRVSDALPHLEQAVLGHLGAAGKVPLSLDM